MRRREFITLLGGAVTAWPSVARAQQRERLRRIGVLLPTTADDPVFQDRVGAFLQGLERSGWTIGRNVRIDTRWATANAAEIRKHAAELAASAPDVILAHGGATVGPLLQATRTVPIVFPVAVDPVGAGFVEGLARPGGLHELRPGAVRVGVLVEPNFALTQPFVSDVQAAALSVGKQIEVLEALTGRDIDTAFARLAQKPTDVLLVGPGPLFNNRRVQLVTLAAYHRVPAIYSQREAAEAGGLMSYGTSLTYAYRQAGVYTGRILKGEKPGDLPVMQSTKFDFVINLNTARAFGLTFPPSLLAIADEVIE